jgi:hypothetical protein
MLHEVAIKEFDRLLTRFGNIHDCALDVAERTVKQILHRGDADRFSSERSPAVSMVSFVPDWHV